MKTWIIFWLNNLFIYTFITKNIHLILKCSINTTVLNSKSNNKMNFLSPQASYLYIHYQSLIEINFFYLIIISDHFIVIIIIIIFILFFFIVIINHNLPHHDCEIIISICWVCYWCYLIEIQLKFLRKFMALLSIIKVVVFKLPHSLIRNLHLLVIKFYLFKFIFKFPSYLLMAFVINIYLLDNLCIW